MSEEKTRDHQQMDSWPLARRNAWALGSDMAFFHFAVTFISSTTVLPAFIAEITSSELVVGIASGLTQAAWFLPQLFIASIVARRPRKKPMIVRSAWLSRPIILLIALVVWLWGDTSPQLVLAFTLTALFVFYFLDAMVSVPWYDLLAKALPNARRGRVLGTAQVAGGLASIGTGVFIRYTFSKASPWTFPDNYALLFAVGGGLFLISATSLLFIEEREPSDVQDVPGAKAILRSLPSLVQKDRHFRLLIVVRLLSSFAGMASAFYVLYATRILGLATEDTGLFVSAQVVGTVTAGFVLGIVQDRWGPLFHIKVNAVLSAIPPLLALAAAPVAQASPLALRGFYLIVYLFLGIYLGGMGWPFFNWIIEYAGERRRPLYIGLMNTLGAISMLAPTLGGLLARNVSYPAVFLGSLLFASLGLGLSFLLPSTR